MIELTDRQKWLKWRKGGIGSSDVPIIMGVSRFKTPLQLYQEKISDSLEEDTTNQFIKDQGNNAETKIRAFYEMMVGVDFAPCLVENSDYPFMRASLDGRTESKKQICEIKLIGKDKFDAAKQQGSVPDDYYPQVQHQLLVSGADRCYFLCYLYDKDDMFFKNAMTMEKFCMIEVRSDKDYQDKMLAKCALFWNNVVSKTPPDLTDRDAVVLKEFTKEAKKLNLLYTKEEKIKNEIKEIEEKFKTEADKTGFGLIRIGKYSLSKQSREGTIDYKAATAGINIDLEKFRKPSGKPFWVIREVKA